MRSPKVPALIHRTPKCQPHPRQLRAGFTRIELIIALVVLCVLVAIAYWAYEGNLWLAGRSEAHSVLSGMYKPQVGYQTLRGECAHTFGDLGFESVGVTTVDERTVETQVYTSAVHAIARSGVPGTNFRAMVTGDLDPSHA